MRKIKVLSAVCIIVSVLSQTGICASASDGEQYITISVDATDDSGMLQYALDTDDPSAFTDSNEFTVLAGTDHTIYVCDAAGNITSQTYSADRSGQEQSESASSNRNEQQINIELDIDKSSSAETEYSDYEYYTDEPVEPGTGTVAEKVKTDGSDDSEKVFYTFTTKEGETLYMVIDQRQDADNVYLLDTVSASDLLVLADSGASPAEKEEDNLLAALSKEDAADEEIVESDGRKSSNSNLIIVIFIVLIGGGVYYYFKIYKNKKEESMDIIDDAMDMEDFEPEEEEEEEFDFDNEEKEKFLEALVNDDDEGLFDADPGEYASASAEIDELDMSDFKLEDDEETDILKALNDEDDIEDGEFEEEV